MVISRKQACNLLDLVMGVSEGALMGCSYWCGSLTNIMAAPEESRTILSLASFGLILLGMTTIFHVYRQLKLLCQRLEIESCVPDNFISYSMPILAIAIFSKMFIGSWLDCAMIGGVNLILLGCCTVGIHAEGIYQLFRTLR